MRIFILQDTVTCLKKNFLGYVRYSTQSIGVDRKSIITSKVYNNHINFFILFLSRNYSVSTALIKVYVPAEFFFELIHGNGKKYI